MGEELDYLNLIEKRRIGTIFKATSTTNFNKTPSANYILL